MIKTEPQFIHAHIESCKLAGDKQNPNLRRVTKKIPRARKFDVPRDALQKALWPHGGPVIVFNAVEDPFTRKARWGVWMEFGVPYGDRAWVFKHSRSDLREAADTCYRFGIFYDPGSFDESQIAAMKRYAKNHGASISVTEHFIRHRLLRPFVKGGPNYMSEEKLIIAGDLEYNLGLLAKRVAKGRKPGSTSLVFCDCHDRIKSGEKLPDGRNIRCFHQRIIVEKFGHKGRSFRSRNEVRPDDVFRFLDIRHFTGLLGVGCPKEPSQVTCYFFRHYTVDRQRSYLARLFAAFKVAREKWRAAGILVAPWHIYSGASIAKAWLLACNVKPFGELNPEFPKEDLGKFRAAFYGPRADTRVTGQIEEIAYADFTSQYPTVSSLIGVQALLTAKKVWSKSTTGLPASFDSLTFDDLFDRSTWKSLIGIALIEPDGDVLPFNDGIGLATPMVMSGQPFWVTLPDVVASIILTGKKPKVLETIELIPEGVQDGIINHPFPNGVEAGIPIDWNKDDVFAELVKARKKTNSISKPPINSVGFGLFGQIDTDQRTFRGDINIWCGGASASKKSNCRVSKLGKSHFPVESPGLFCSPWAGVITGGGRLLLAMLEVLGERHELKYAMTNTDAVAFIRANGVSREEFSGRVLSIQAEFEKLSPYGGDFSFLKIEAENYSLSSGEFAPLYIFQISTLLERPQSREAQNRQAAIHAIHPPRFCGSLCFCRRH